MIDNLQGCAQFAARVADILKIKVAQMMEIKLDVERSIRSPPITNWVMRIITSFALIWVQVGMLQEYIGLLRTM